ncbi:hypothetical protein [Bauldia litoralis]|uniref:hypothetical protein n=1 Tax=Bauldia litoralis TaxID=665467 RepID=UPI0011139CAF|nr:hypothetical protein [Bauldia litoralis]
MFEVMHFIAMVDNATSWILERISDALTHPFSIALFASGFGAFFGARGAQLLIKKEQEKQEFLSKIRAINGAIELLLSIIQVFFRMKKQFIRPMKERHSLSRLQYEYAVRRPGGKFELKADLETLPNPAIPVELLQKAIFDRLDLTGRPCICVQFFCKLSNP